MKFNSAQSLVGDLTRVVLLPLKIALLVGSLTTVIVVFIPNRYRSQAKLLPVDPGNSFGGSGLAAAAAVLGVGAGGQGGGDANYVDILNSRWLHEGLLNTKFKFHQQTWRFGADEPMERTLYDYLGIENQDRAVLAVDELVDASKDSKSNMITITAETRSPELSQALVHRAMALLNEFVVLNSRSRGREKASFARSRLQEAEQSRDQAETALKVFLRVNRSFGKSGDPDVLLSGQKLEVELALRRQLVATLAVNLEQALLDSKNDIPILNVLDAGNRPFEKSRPKRAIIVMVFALFSGLGVLAWQERVWLRSRLMEPNV